jgi:hypothetical protein
VHVDKERPGRETLAVSSTDLTVLPREGRHSTTSGQGGNRTPDTRILSLDEFENTAQTDAQSPFSLLFLAQVSTDCRQLDLSQYWCAQRDCQPALLIRNSRTIHTSTQLFIPTAGYMISVVRWLVPLHYCSATLCSFSIVLLDKWQQPNSVDQVPRLTFDGYDARRDKEKDR